MTFYGVEITFERQAVYSIDAQSENETVISMHTYCNCTAAKVHEIRQTILSEGLQVPVSLTQWAVVFPSAIKTFSIYRQDSFFNKQSNIRLTVFDVPVGEIQKMI